MVRIDNYILLQTNTNNFRDNLGKLPVLLVTYLCTQSSYIYV